MHAETSLTKSLRSAYRLQSDGLPTCGLDLDRYVDNNRLTPIQDITAMERARVELRTPG